MRISDWSSDVCSSDLVVHRTHVVTGGHFGCVRRLLHLGRELTQFGFGIDQELPGYHHLPAGFEATCDLYHAIGAGPKRDRPWFVLPRQPQNDPLPRPTGTDDPQRRRTALTGRRGEY